LWESRSCVHRAGKAPTKDSIPILKEIAANLGASWPRRKLCFDALSALEELGEPPEYFLALAKKYRDKDSLDRARYAILMLGRKPTEPVATSLRQIRDEAQRLDEERYRDIIRAVEEIESVRQAAREYTKAATLAAQAELLMGHLEQVWTADGVDEYGENSHLAPLTVWSARTLRQLSESFPDQIALLLSSRHDAEGCRGYVARFLGEAAAREFQRLEGERK